ncbi:acyltransferase [Mycolicibacterium pulveris]|uniref:Acyltransferase n=1 Tax=Mycolicibacterium pulveris TaxID=36813 RepID=A0A7I7UFM6_MYCPV|nr:acyltransferase [Mycolicibacterium pulveris]MCV6979102.1 acyltransferase [Mycolicibacterium pulveris]BBY79693.1 acyltransferase [Mycolicibacterium pulveris]
MTIKPRDTADRLSSKPAARTTGRIIGLDGARGLSAVGVAVMHVAGNFSPNTAAQTKIGIVGMSLIFFFVLSGFLLFLPYVRRLTEDAAVATAPSARNFAIHRFARIVPGYLVIFLLCNYVFGVVYVENPTEQALGTDAGTGTITDPWQLLANLTLVQTYIPEYVFTGLNPSWSLTLEFAFYASLPLAAVVLFTMRRRTAMRPLLLAASLPVLFIVIGFVGKLLLPVVSNYFGVADPEMMQWGPNWVSVYLRSFLVNADNFAFGMLAAIVVVAIENGTVREAAARRVRPVSALALPVVLGVSFALIALGNMFGTSGVAIASALAILVIVAPLSCGQRSRIGEGLELAPFQFVGKVSLSLYLLHFPTMLMLHRFGLLAGDSLGAMCLNIVVVLAVTLAVSAVTYYSVEKPAMNIARRYRYRWR